MHPNEPILKILIQMQLQVSSIDELRDDINVHGVKRLSKGLVEEILKTQKSNLKTLWELDEDLVKEVWGIYERLIESIAPLSIAQIQGLTEITDAFAKGEIEFVGK